MANSPADVLAYSWLGVRQPPAAPVRQRYGPRSHQKQHTIDASSTISSSSSSSTRRKKGGECLSAGSYFGSRSKSTNHRRVQHASDDVDVAAKSVDGWHTGMARSRKKVGAVPRAAGAVAENDGVLLLDGGVAHGNQWPRRPLPQVRDGARNNPLALQHHVHRQQRLLPPPPSSLSHSHSHSNSSSSNKIGRASCRERV